MPPISSLWGMDDEEEPLYTPAAQYTPMPTASPALSDLGAATNYAPVASGLELYGDAIRRTQHKKATAEQEYKDLVKQQFAPPGELSVSQAFGATALAFLPALVGLAAGGDNKYALAATGAKLGGAGSDAYLGNLAKSDLYANQEAGKLAEQKNQEIAGFDRTSNALELAGLSQDAQNQRAAQSNETRLAIAEAARLAREDQKQKEYQLNVQALGKEEADRIQRIKGGLELGAEGQIKKQNADRLLDSQNSLELEGWEPKTGTRIDTEVSKKAKAMLGDTAIFKAATKMLDEAIASGDYAKIRVAATEANILNKQRAGAGANYTVSEQRLFNTIIPAIIGNPGASWEEIANQTALGIKPGQLLSELNKALDLEVAAKLDGWGLQPRQAPLRMGQLNPIGANVSSAGAGGVSPGTAAILRVMGRGR